MKADGPAYKPSLGRQPVFTWRLLCRWRPLAPSTGQTCHELLWQSCANCRTGNNDGAMATLSRYLWPQSVPMLKPFWDCELFPGTSPHFPVNGSSCLPYKCNVTSGRNMSWLLFHQVQLPESHPLSFSGFPIVAMKRHNVFSPRPLPPF